MSTIGSSGAMASADGQKNRLAQTAQLRVVQCEEYRILAGRTLYRLLRKIAIFMEAPERKAKTLSTFN